MRVYAYVVQEDKGQPEAFLWGAKYQGSPVSTHKDIGKWTYSKRITLAAANGRWAGCRVLAEDHYLRRTAQAVAKLRGWG